jgi:hypothetical protein
MITQKNSPTPQKLSGIMQKTLGVFVLWHNIVKTLTKDHRYSLGLKISNLFADIIEQASLAQFNPADTMRIIYIDRAIAKNDTLKFMLYALYETRGIANDKLIVLIEPCEEVGKMLYGWKRSIETKKKSL